ncbi:hypothetical protein GCM10010873_30140 [Cypionkella aquatica]|uniref:Uncharacterized protein n=1 Tax=Cypionkella aquatica TaxID=1756042 RepID=A0AA37X393_9RHOB|nr:hypothetical protein GCM10010873_30140 [Cypionkella aquatica]
MRGVAVANVPLVDLGLQGVALGEQGAVLRAFGLRQIRHARPKPIGVNASAGQGLAFKKIRENLIHLQTVPGDARNHGSLADLDFSSR